jgi:mannose-P-dolichol utilization defect protein 1
MWQILETTSYAISLAYASRNHFPFSTYGENFFLTIQNVVITLLILFFSGQGVGADIKKPLSTTRGNSGKVVAGAAVAAVTGFVLWSETLCPLGTRQWLALIPPRRNFSHWRIAVALLQAATLPLSLISKAPQIISNLRNQSTGNLSAFAVFNALLGCLARLFTTKQEVNDQLIFWGFFGAAVLNAVLAVQMLMYWNNSDVGAKTTRQRRRATEEGIAEPINMPIEEKSPTGKRWARKLD